MRLVLLGDIHAHRLLVPPWRLLSKRLLGQMNLWLRRRYRFDLRLLRPVVERAAGLNPDLVLLSGDLSSTALEGEFDDVKEALAPLISKIPSLLVAGNHDRYTFRSARRRTIEEAFVSVVPAQFPHVQRLDERWTLLTLDAAVPRLVSSRGRLGSAQMREASTTMQQLTSEQGLVVLCHYPFAAPEGIRMPWVHGLDEVAALRDLLADCRAKIIYMHGHIHRSWHWRPTDPRHAHVIDINAGSPTLCATPDRAGHGFWQIDLAADAAAPPVAIRHEPTTPEAGQSDWRTQTFR